MTSGMTSGMEAGVPYAGAEDSSTPAHGGPVHSARTSLFLSVYDAAYARASSSPFAFNREHAQDIAQEVVAEYASTDRSRIINPAAWANRVAASVGARMWNEQIPPAPAPSDVNDTVALMAFLTDGRSVSQAGIAGQQSSMLLGILSPREQQLVQLAAHQVPHALIAEQMGYANAGSVKVTLSRIRSKVIEAAPDIGLDLDWADHPRVY